MALLTLAGLLLGTVLVGCLLVWAHDLGMEDDGEY